MASYQFTKLDFSTSGMTFQAITGINNAGILVGYAGNGLPIGFNPSTSFLWQVVNGVGLFTPFASVAGGAQVQVGGLNNATSAAGATVVATTLSGTGATIGAASVLAIPGATATGVNGSGHLLGVNDAGTAVGYLVSNAGGTNEIDTAASVGAGGALAAIPLVLPSGQGTSISSHATGIDYLGDIVGTMTVSGAPTTAGVAPTVEGFVSFAGQASVTPFSVPGATSTEILGVNNQRQVVGNYVDSTGSYGFVYDYNAAAGVNPLTVITVAGATSITVYGINDQGDLVGSYTDATGTHGFLEALLGTPQTVLNPIGNSTVALVTGSNGVQVGGSNAVTLLDPGLGHATLIANSGNDTILASGTNDTIVAGFSANYFIDDSLGGGAAIFLGAGSGVANAGLGSVVESSLGGANSIVGNGSIIFAAQVATTGRDTVGASSIASVANTIIGGAGTTDVTGFGTAGGTLFFGGSGLNVVAPGTSASVGSATLVGTNGTNYFAEGAGGGVLFGGTVGTNYLTGNNVPATATIPSSRAATVIVALAGKATITAYSGSVFLTGSTDQVVLSGISASVGNLSLVGSQSSGNDIYALGTSGAREQLFEGSGNDTVFFGNGGDAQIVAGSGAETYYLASGVTTGADTIYGFKPGADHVLLQNYDANAVDRAVRGAAPAPGGSSVITLNGVRIEFYGVGSLSSSSFQPG